MLPSSGAGGEGGGGGGGRVAGLGTLTLRAGAGCCTDDRRGEGGRRGVTLDTAGVGEPGSSRGASSETVEAGVGVAAGSSLSSPSMFLECSRLGCEKCAAPSSARIKHNRCFKTKVLGDITIQRLQIWTVRTAGN